MYRILHESGSVVGTGPRVDALEAMVAAKIEAGLLPGGLYYLDHGSGQREAIDLSGDRGQRSADRPAAEPPPARPPRVILPPEPTPMLRCLDCRQAISRYAAVCPHCGSRLPSLPASRRRLGFWIAVGLWALLMLFAVCSLAGR